jgi:hypothetical protein
MFKIKNMVKIIITEFELPLPIGLFPHRIDRIYQVGKQGIEP